MIRNNNQHGFILLPVIIAIVLIATIAFLLNNQSALNVDETAGVLEAEQAEQIARAGLAHTSWGVQNTGCAGDMSMPSVAFGPGSYSTTVESAATTTQYTFNPDQDANVIESSPTANDGSSAELIIKENTAAGMRRAVVHFDLSSIPAGARVASATAWFYETLNNNASPVKIHPVTAAWTEAAVTWDNIGTNYDSQVFGVLPQQSAAGVWIPVNLTALTQSWVNDASTNYGIMLIGMPDDLTTQFSSREYGTANLRPYLEVTTADGAVSPVKISATGTLTGDPSPANDITRTLTRTDVPAWQPGSNMVLQPGPEGTDTYIYEWKPGWNYGASSEIFVENRYAYSIANGLLKFDLATVPYGARVTSAVLELYQTNNSLSGGPVGIRRVTSAWVEGAKNGANGSPNWTERDTGILWANVGGDYDAASFASTTVPAGTGWSAWEFADLVNGWVSGAFNNDGLVLVAETFGTAAHFASSDAADPTLRPKLTLTYACECGNPCLTLQGSGTVALVVVDPTTLLPADAYKKALFESWGYTVNLIGENTNAAGYMTAAASNDVFYISETVNSSQVGTRIKDVPIGVVSEDGAYNSDLGFATGSAWPVGASINITDTSHYITALFPTGALDIYEAGMEQLTVSGSLATGLQPLADSGGAGALVVLDKGATMTGGGSAAGPRVMLPLGRNASFNWDYLNANGRLLVQRALQWGTGNIGGAPAPQLLFVSGGTTVVAFPSGDMMVIPTAQEQLRIDLIESWGYTVNLIADDDSQANFDAAVATADVAYVAEDITSGTLGTKLREATIGVVIEEQKLPQEFGIASSDTVFSETSIEVTDNTHYITQPFSLGAVAFAASAQPVGGPDGTMAPGLQVLAVRPSTTTGMLDVIDTGSELFDTGTAAGRRVKLPWGDNDFDINSLTADGLTIMRRAIEWAEGAGCGSNPPLLLVVGNASSPSSEDNARRTLIESWCYTVTLIDASASQSEFDAAGAVNDVIYISEEVDHTQLLTKVRDLPIGVVSEERYQYSHLGFASGMGSSVSMTSLKVTDNTHSITAGLSLGELTIVASSQPLQNLQGTLSPDLIPLGTHPSNTNPSLAILETGARIWTGGSTVPARRVFLPWGGDAFQFSALNDDGRTIMQRAIEWANGAGSTAAPTYNLLLVVGESGTLSSADADRKALVESWGHTVTVIDDSDSQANFDAAAAAADVAYVTESVVLAELYKKLKAASIGVVNEDPELHDVFGFSTARYLSTENPSMATDAAHYITEPFGGATVLALFTSSQPLGAAVGTLPSGLEIIGNWSGGSMSSLGGLLVLDTGAAISGGGTADGRRVQLPWGGQDGVSIADITALTADGRTILQRAIEWGAGTGAGGGGGGGGTPAGVVFEEFTDASDNGGTSLAINKPAGTAAGDLLIAAVATDGDTAASLNPPAGWNVVNVATQGGQVTFGVWWKLATASESSSYTFTWSGSEHAYGWVMRFTGHDPVSPIDVTSNAGGSASAPASPVRDDHGSRYVDPAAGWFR